MLRLNRRTAERHDERGHAPGAAPILGPLELDDGPVVRFRRATGDDAAALRCFYLELSAPTLLKRFMTPTPRLPESSLAYLCDVGGLDREIVLATVDGEIVAEGRYHRAAGSNAAEVAMVVADGWQRRGIGSALSDRLAGLAGLRGIECFGGTMLAENDAARRLLRVVAPGADLRVSSGEIEFSAPLPRRR
jgi:GNAT superfamily N-acetyltransferase